MIALVGVALGFRALRTLIPPPLFGTEDTQLLFVGTSHVGDGIAYTRMPWPTAMLAHAGADQRLLTKAFLEHRERWPRLRVAVVEVDEVSLVGDRFWTQRFDLSATCGELDLDAHQLPSSRAEPVRLAWVAWNLARGRGFSALHASRRLTLETVRRLLASPRGPWRPEKSSPNQVSTSSISVARTREGLARLERDAVEPSANVRALGELVAALEASGVRVVLLSLPQHPAYLGLRPERFVRATRAALDEVRKVSRTEPTVWDDRGMSLTDEDFTNATHLSSLGAARYASLLSRRLSCLGALAGECLE
ncbi:MAG: hypothetical protein HYV07_30970 [Deltaproteobacteria bacterium]|nr:hypothetical protein [Deltaproteobacteria bacterium]